jgi:hypothetical protein
VRVELSLARCVECDIKLRFSIRDLLWLAALVALAVEWRLDRSHAVGALNQSRDEIKVRIWIIIFSPLRCVEQRRSLKRIEKLPKRSSNALAAFCRTIGRNVQTHVRRSDTCRQVIK